MRLPQSLRLFGNVDPNGTPGNAPAAADAAGFAELFVPGAELVQQPLAVARGRGFADDATVDVGKLAGEAGIPTLPASGVIPGQTGGILDVRAEAGGANHGAIAAAQATGCTMMMEQAIADAIMLMQAAQQTGSCL